MKIELQEIADQSGYRMVISTTTRKALSAMAASSIFARKYQREFIYKDKQRDDVIKTVKQDFPLNVMYWVKNADSTFEVLDGQQRTISICEYVEGKFSLDNLYFHNLQDSEQEQILNYQLMVYFCEGNDKEKLDWFQTINIAGEKLTDQELRNAIYSGTWVTDAKRLF